MAVDSIRTYRLGVQFWAKCRHKHYRQDDLILVLRLGIKDCIYDEENGILLLYGLCIA